MKRREIVKGLVLGPLAISAIGGDGAARAAAQKPVMLVLRDVTLATPPELIFAFIDPLVSLNVPLAVAIDPSQAPGADAGKIKILLQGLLRDYPGFVEICVSTRLPKDVSWFGAARNAAEAQSRLRQFVMDRAIPATRRLPITLVSDDSADVSGIRTAGFRLALTGLRARGVAKADSFPSGVNEISGGMAVTTLSQFEDLPASLVAEQGTDDPAVIHVSMSALAGMSRQDVFAAAARAAVGLSGKADSGAARFILPTDYLLQYRGGYSRRIGIALAQMEAGAAGDEAAGQLQQALLAAGTPVTVITPSDAPLLAPSPAAATARPDSCLWLGAVSNTQDEAGLSQQLAVRLKGMAAAGVVADCVAARQSAGAVAQSAAEAGFAMLLPAKPDAAWFVGLDDSGLLHLPVLCTLGQEQEPLSAAALAKDILGQAGNVDDVVMLVQQDFFAGAGRGAALKEAISTLAGAPENQVAPVAVFGIGGLPENRALSLVNMARRGRVLGELEFRPPAEAERGLLMEDARMAWSYFSRFADARTALVPGTVAGGTDGEYAFSYVTMWDCGTQLLALVAAHGLGLIGDKDYLDLTSKILAALHSGDTEAGGLRLPKSFMATTGSGEGEPGYDATDMGRLLNALKMVQGYSKGQIDPTAIVAGWDLGKTIADRQVHSVKDGAFKSIQNTTYANYALQGFRAWGFDVEPAFGIDMTGDSVDQRIRVLEALAQSEPVGAEPHVLEGIELGHSPFSRLVSDVLYEAQLKRYRETGKFVCVSEGPLDHEPWFSYQGYRILAEGDPWTFEVADSNPRFHTEGFRLANQVVSTKMAYSWAALRPQDYSRQLLEHVRGLARIPGMGLSSGIYSETGRPMRLYSDLNTNGIVLEAIAYVLGGNTPLHLRRMAD